MTDISISFRATIRDAMEALDETAQKVLLVVDDEKKMVGTLTDGDIRRCILKNQDLIATIENAYNPDPYYVFEDEYEEEYIKRLFTRHKISLIPVIRRDMTVVEYVTVEKLFGKKEKEKINAPVIIMAGGKGTRLKPFTKVLPKPLIPVGDKTVIDQIIDRFREHGITDYYLTVNYMSKIIQAYFEEKEPDYNISFVRENEPRGTAGSIKLVKDKIDKPFFVSNCDIIIEADYSDIFHFHKRGRYDITLVAAAKKYNIPYGVCDLNGDGSLGVIQEKPEYNFLVNTGLYVLEPGTLTLIPDSGMFHMTHLIETVKENNGSIGVYPVSENSWIDVGQWEEYRRALREIEGF